MLERKKRTLAIELTTANQDVYTVPARFTSEINSIYINNASSSAVTFSLDWYDSASTTYYTLAEAVELSANSLLQITDYPLYLKPADSIRALASANSAVNMTIAVEEYFDTTP